MHFRMTVLEKIDGPDVRMWITRIGPAGFCISWDDWFAEVSVMAWHDTPPDAVERLLAVAGAATLTTQATPTSPRTYCRATFAAG